MNYPLVELNFWIQDSEGNKYYEIMTDKDAESFIVPFEDKWCLNWENPSYLEESSSSAISLIYKVDIVNQLPIASLKADKTNGLAPLSVWFTGAGLDYDGEVVSYLWSFGDGSISNEQNPVYTFQNAGTYTVALTVTDDCGATGTDSVIITVNKISGIE